MSVCVSLRLGSQNDERVATPYPLRPFSTQRPFSLVLEEASFLPEEVLRYTDVTLVKESFISHPCSHALKHFSHHVLNFQLKTSVYKAVCAVSDDVNEWGCLLPSDKE